MGVVGDAARMPRPRWASGTVMEIESGKLPVESDASVELAFGFEIM